MRGKFIYLAGRFRRRLEVTSRTSGQSSDRKYLFVCGQGRSGTTLAAQLLGSNHDIAIGIERYGWWEEERLGPSLFSAKRFFQIRWSDTFPDGFLLYAEHYVNMREKYEKALYVGDKLPNLFGYIPEVNRNFGGATFIFCHRNVYEVAASWDARAHDADDHLWNRSMDYKAAPEGWNSSLRFAARAKKQGLHIVACDYAALTDPEHGEDYYCNLLRALALPITERDIQSYRNMVDNRSTRKVRSMTHTTQSEIAALVDTEAVDEFCEAFETDPRSLIAPPGN